MVLKVVGALIVIWLGFMVLGAVIHAIGTLIIIGLVVTAGVVGYNAIKASSQRRQIR